MKIQDIKAGETYINATGKESEYITSLATLKKWTKTPPKLYIKVCEGPVGFFTKTFRSKKDAEDFVTNLQPDYTLYQSVEMEDKGGV